MCKYASEYFGKYVEVVDCFTNNIIASGKVIYGKTNDINCGISFDGKWFFRETSRLKYNIVETADLYIADIENSDLKWDYWKNYDKNDSHDIDAYRDFCYDEIDQEIKPYIDELNNINCGLKTVSSCCGHGSGFWYIQFIFYNFEILSDFIHVVETFNNNLRLTTYLRSGTAKNEIQLHFEPTVKDIDFKLLKSFIRKLQILY